MSLDKNIGPVN